MALEHALRRLDADLRAGTSRAWALRCALALALAPACGPAASDETGTTASSAWPADTVVTIDGVAITAAEVDAEIEPFLVFEPRSTDAHARRLAFTHVVLPRAVARLRGGAESYESARERAAGVAAYVAANGEAPPEAPGEFSTYGGPRQVGWATWQSAFELEPGQWSELVAATYDFRVVRLIRREDGPTPANLVVELAVVSFPFVPEDFSSGSAEVHYPEHRMTIVDPAWRAIVPEWIQYEMHVHDGDG